LVSQGPPIKNWGEPLFFKTFPKWVWKYNPIGKGSFFPQNRNWKELRSFSSKGSLFNPHPNFKEPIWAKGSFP